MKVLDKIREKIGKNKPVEEVIVEEVKKPTYEELSKKFGALLREYKQIEDQCAHEGYSYEDMRFKTQDLIKEILDVDRDIRLIQEPTIDYHPKIEWTENKITLNEFVRKSQQGILTDDNCFARYSSKRGLSDIYIHPSDIIAEKYRTDFTHVNLIYRENK